MKRRDDFEFEELPYLTLGRVLAEHLYQTGHYSFEDAVGAVRGGICLSEDTYTQITQIYEYYVTLVRGGTDKEQARDLALAQVTEYPRA